MTKRNAVATSIALIMALSFSACKEEAQDNQTSRLFYQPVTFKAGLSVVGYDLVQTS